MKKSLLFLLWILFALRLSAQFAPAAGQEGSTAIFKDSAIFRSWATDCMVQRGYITIEDTTQTYSQGDTTSNRAFFGQPENAIGFPGSNTDVVSLGDGGSALLTFEKPIVNGPGADFAVFENGFQALEPPFDFYLELAFVAVSTNGHRFVRFPAVSLTQDSLQITTFGQINPEKIHNLAGKYRQDYGTPFDLADLSDSTGINIDSINFVRITDVVGDIHTDFASKDSQGHVINDPWPSPFWTGGFDLNGVGIINEYENPGKVVFQKKAKEIVKVWPVPANTFLKIKSVFTEKIKRVVILDLDGNIVLDTKNNGFSVEIPVTTYPTGIYFVKIITERRMIGKTFLVKHGT